MIYEKILGVSRPVHFKPVFVQGSTVQCKCSVNSCQYVANSNFAFWNFLEFFSNTWLDEFTDAEPTHMGVQLYVT